MTLPHKRTLLFALPAFVLPGFLLIYLAIAICWAWVTFDQAMAGARVLPEAHLSARQTHILTLVEDPTFHEHIGVSLGEGQGLATISGAVARDVYLDGVDLQGAAGALQKLYRAVFACCRKVDLGRDLMAVVLNAKLSKERQLAVYVSRVYMGRNDGRQIRGLPQAARSYFGTSLGETTDDEFIRLVAMIKAPNGLHPIRNRAAFEARVARIRALVAGQCRPGGWFDTSLEECGQVVNATPGRDE